MKRQNKYILLDKFFLEHNTRLRCEVNFGVYKSTLVQLFSVCEFK